MEPDDRARLPRRRFLGLEIEDVEPGEPSPRVEVTGHLTFAVIAAASF